MIHEFAHSACDSCDNNLKTVLSEAVALYAELNANDFMRNNNYYKEAEFMQYFRLNYLRTILGKTKSALELYYVYSKYGKVSKKNYEKEFDYDYNYVIESVNKNSFFEMDGYLDYIFGFFIATYMYGKFKEDYSFSENINILNKNLEFSLNDSIDDILKIIQVEDLNNSTIFKMSEYFNDYIENYNNKKTNSIKN